MAVSPVTSNAHAFGKTPHVRMHKHNVSMHAQHTHMKYVAHMPALFVCTIWLVCWHWVDGQR